VNIQNARCNDKKKVLPCVCKYALTDHLTGLEPAGPLFTKQNCQVRMCKGDANFTEAIHTNGDPLFGLGESGEDGKNGV
jgi:hypothetical protein